MTGLSVFSALLLSSLAGAASPPHALTSEVIVEAPAQEAWARWTTEEGVKSFFPGAKNGVNIRLEPDGPYEFFFLPENPAGMRGCEGCKILGWQEGRMLSFTWTNKPEMAVRPHRTHVVLRFEAIDAARTRVTLHHDGWGEGADWQVAHDYFADAWTRVLEAYRASLAEGGGKP